MIPGPKYLVFADRFFPYWSHWGFLFLLGFPHLKIKIKVSGDSKVKPFLLGDGLIGNMIPGPKYLVFADRFFPYLSHWGFLFLLGFPHLKIKIKVSGDSKVKPFLLGDGFSKT